MVNTDTTVDQQNRAFVETALIKTCTRAVDIVAQNAARFNVEIPSLFGYLYCYTLYGFKVLLLSDKID